MSAYLMGRVFYTDLSLPLKMTLLALADVADDDGTRVMLGQSRIARKVGCSDRTVRRHIGTLRNMGYLEKEKRVGAHGQDRQRIVVDALPTHEQIALMFPRPAKGGRPANLSDRTSPVGSTGHLASVDRTPMSDDSPEDSSVDSPKANAGTSGAVVDPGEIGSIPATTPKQSERLLVSDRWPYFLSKLQDQDDAWAKVTMGACVRIAQQTDSEAVSTALSFAAMNAPIIEGSAYGWLLSTAKNLKAARDDPQAEWYA